MPIAREVIYVDGMPRFSGEFIPLSVMEEAQGLADQWHDVRIRVHDKLGTETWAFGTKAPTEESVGLYEDMEWREADAD